jgi:hypothetical protein
LRQGNISSIGGYAVCIVYLLVSAIAAAAIFYRLAVAAVVPRIIIVIRIVRFFGKFVDNPRFQQPRGVFLGKLYNLPACPQLPVCIPYLPPFSDGVHSMPPP